MTPAQTKPLTTPRVQAAAALAWLAALMPGVPGWKPRGTPESVYLHCRSAGGDGCGYRGAVQGIRLPGGGIWVRCPRCGYQHSRLKTSES